MTILTHILLLSFISLGCKSSSFRSIDEHRDSSETVGEKKITEVVIPTPLPTKTSIEKKTPLNSKTEKTGKSADVPNCQKSTPLSMTAPLKFIQRKDCTFGMGNNLSRKARFMRAMESQSIDVILPPLQELCSLSLKSRQDALHYDDYFFMSLNDQVLVASEVRWTDFLDDEGDFKAFDFMKLRDQDHLYVEDDSSYGTPYCYGDKNCKVPKHDATGPFELNIVSSGMDGISKMAMQESKFRFTVYATGDDDDEDCDFSSFELDLVMDYLPASSK